MDWDGVGHAFTEATSNAFMSGSPTVGRSLLDKLDRRVLVLQDMTAIMTRNPVKWDEFFGTVRCAFDGTYTKASGAMDHDRRPRMRFTILGAVTEAIYGYIDRDIDLGQRFLFVRMGRDNSRETRLAQFRMAWHANQDGDWRQSAKDQVRDIITSLRDTYDCGSCVVPIGRLPDEPDNEYQLRMTHLNEERPTGWHQVDYPLVSFPDEYMDFVFALANTVTRTRSAKTDHTKGIEREEAPNRLGKQFHTLASMRAVAELRTEATPIDMEFLRVVARDTISPSRLELLDKMYEHSTTAGADGLTTADLACRTHIPIPQLEALLAHWHYNRYVTRSNSITPRYLLAEEAIDDLRTCRLLADISAAQPTDPLPV